MIDFLETIFHFSKWTIIFLIVGFIALFIWRHWVAIFLLVLIGMIISILCSPRSLGGLLFLGYMLLVGFGAMVAPILEMDEVKDKSKYEKIMFVIDGYSEVLDELFFDIAPAAIKSEAIEPIYEESKQMGKQIMNLDDKE